MNTPPGNISNRRKRRSSIINSPIDASILFRTSYNNSPLGPGTPESISKLKKQNLTKDLLRKQQQYKTRKQKRAELIEKNRNLSIDENDKKDLNTLDEDYYSNFNVQDYGYERDNLKAPKLEIKEEKIEFKQEKIEQEETNIDVKPNITSNKTTNEKKNGLVSTSSSIGSSIISRIASIKNTFKNIVNYGQSSTNKSISNMPPITKCDTSNGTVNTKKPINNLNYNNLKKHNIIMHRSSSTSNIKQNNSTHSSTSKLNALNNNPNVKVFSNKNVTNMNNYQKLLKKQESTSSCNKIMKPSTTSTSSLKIQSDRTMSSKENLNKPIFKISKIKYDDRHLFDMVNLDKI